MISNALKKIFSLIRLQDKSSNSIFISSNSVLKKTNTVKIVNSQISLENDAQLILGENVCIENYSIRITNGVCKIEHDTQLTGVKNSNTNSIYINNGTLTISNNCIIQSEFCVRFGGNCFVDCYTGIMYGTEIRCDEKLSIGKYNMISYDCMIYDTNTHCSYTTEKRRELTNKSFPYIGLEHEKPSTSPVSIGDDCWLGKRSVILKGVTIGNNSTVATCAVVTKSAPNNSLSFGNPSQFKIKS
jgi:acetyltransferase-like isoleucine patch superfamily enzyme